LPLATDNEGRAVFHTAEIFNEKGVFQGIFNLAKYNLTTEEVKECLLAQIMRERWSSIWQLIALK
jgi:hypothetical protein